MQLGSDGFKHLPGDQSTGFVKTDGIAKVRWTAAPEQSLAQSFQFKVGFVQEESHETYAGLTETDFTADPVARYAASAQDVMAANQNQAVLRHEVNVSERWQFETDVYRTRFHRNWYKLDGYRDANGDRTSLLSLYNSNEVNVLTADTPDGEALLVKQPLVRNPRRTAPRYLQVGSRKPPPSGVRSAPPFGLGGPFPMARCVPPQRQSYAPD
jgi:outer membrane receptor for Fe3+-dicitrate